MATEIRWLKRPQAHDYVAATSYLSLLLGRARVKDVIRALAKAPMTSFAAKDIFRASQLSLLGVSNGHVRQDQRKIRAGEELSPILLVRDKKHGKVVIADGYHRLCAVYSFNEDAVIPCQIV